MLNPSMEAVPLKGQWSVTFEFSGLDTWTSWGHHMWQITNVGDPLPSIRCLTLVELYGASIPQP